jgi:GMP synthase (glutamine-hydrolysing)
MKLLIVQTGATLPAMIDKHGDFPEWFRRGFGLAPNEIVTVRVDAGKTLPAAQGVDAAVITGSGAMVSDRLDWSERTAEWLHAAAQKRLPILGVCYGHQLLAHAFGGHVDYNPRGREIGTVEIESLPVANEDALFGSSPSKFSAHATHLQTVLRPPRDAVILARSVLDDCQAVRYAPHVWGVQFHPEFSVAHMRGYLHERSEPMDAEGLDSRALSKSVRASPHARDLLRKFVRIAAKLRR